MKELTLNQVRESQLRSNQDKISKSASVKDPALYFPAPQIAVLDANGIIQTVNEPWQLFEKENTASESHAAGNVGMSYLDICKRPDGRFFEHSSEAISGIRGVLSGSASSFELEYPCHIPLKKRWFHMSVILLPGSAGAIVSHTDVTGLKLMEKMKDDFINIVSHELKTPITSLRGIAHILKLSFLKKMRGEGARLLSTMDAQLNKLTRIIGDLLDIYTIPGQEMKLSEEDFNFRDLVLETVENVRNLSPLHFISVKKNEPVVYRGDRFRLEQVITNLLTNAVKYSPQSNQVLISSTLKADTILLSVQDFGIGVASEDITSIFERFYRVNNGSAFSGLGLGLYISSEIIKAHKGNLWVESNTGSGSTFCFSLPLRK